MGLLITDWRVAPWGLAWTDGEWLQSKISLASTARRKSSPSLVAKQRRSIGPCARCGAGTAEVHYHNGHKALCYGEEAANEVRTFAAL
jgi:hypothetical protein